MHKMSNFYKLKSKYTRTIFKMELTEPLRLPAFQCRDDGDSSCKSSLCGILGEEFCDWEVYAVKRHGKLIFFTWVSDVVFEKLALPEAGDFIVKWLHNLDMDGSLSEDVQQPEEVMEPLRMHF